MQQQDRTVEQKLARLASRSHGVVTRAQLRSAGLTEGEIRQRLQSGALLREYRGVYRVGHRAPSLEARYLAAVYACGDGALLSGHAAAHLLAILPGPPPRPEVTAPTERHIPGITTRRHRSMHPLDAQFWRGVPITSPARTIVDLAATLAAHELARAAHEAAIRHNTAPREIEAVLQRQPNRRGAKELKRVISGDEPVTRSALERRFLTLLRNAQLPLPITNRPAGTRYVDCRWPQHNLTVELDGYRYHSSRHAWEQDRRREREAFARGDDFRRYTYGDVFERPRPMLAELQAVLPRPAAT
jgi:very-short-patch-repair endonuclease